MKDRINFFLLTRPSSAYYLQLVILFIFSLVFFLSDAPVNCEEPPQHNLQPPGNESANTDSIQLGYTRKTIKNVGIFLLSGFGLILTVTDLIGMALDPKGFEESMMDNGANPDHIRIFLKVTFALSLYGLFSSVEYFQNTPPPEIPINAKRDK